MSDEENIKELRIAASKIKSYGSSNVNNCDLKKTLETLADITEDRDKWWVKAKQLEHEIKHLQHYQRIVYKER